MEHSLIAEILGKSFNEVNPLCQVTIASSSFILLHLPVLYE